MLKTLFSAILITLALTTPSSSQSVGVDFKNMPVGTKIFFEASYGDTWVSTFKGKKGKNYVVSVDVKKAGRSYRGTQRYTLDGHMQRWNNGGGYTEKWRPHSCVRVLGACSHKWTDSNGRGTSWVSENKLVGNKLTRSSRPKREADMQITQHILGKYNLSMRQDWSTRRGEKRWIKIVKIVEP